ncbi:hypothetical protein RFI_03405 [Reticulomyxa filosa]|uniref:Uncharacterized protein n=1 Tax=Reticulomyxa filosa TaxID=46433 RepID=X6P573_RETFI|nr:hypothetical protein RFI_03405 [Reticulomyxa filosa]|eukprot:ETO33700.1 hypothetical protein RFI_03405 [Reticulomyxa filosa]
MHYCLAKVRYLYLLDQLSLFVDQKYDFEHRDKPRVLSDFVRSIQKERKMGNEDTITVTSPSTINHFSNACKFVLGVSCDTKRNRLPFQLWQLVSTHWDASIRDHEMILKYCSHFYADGALRQVRLLLKERKQLISKMAQSGQTKFKQKAVSLPTSIPQTMWQYLCEIALQCESPTKAASLLQRLIAQEVKYQLLRHEFSTKATASNSHVALLEANDSEWSMYLQMFEQGQLPLSLRQEIFNWVSWVDIMPFFVARKCHSEILLYSLFLVDACKWANNRVMLMTVLTMLEEAWLLPHSRPSLVPMLVWVVNYALTTLGHDLDDMTEAQAFRDRFNSIFSSSSSSSCFLIWDAHDPRREHPLHRDNQLSSSMRLSTANSQLCMSQSTHVSIETCSSLSFCTRHYLSCLYIHICICICIGALVFHLNSLYWKDWKIQPPDTDPSDTNKAQEKLIHSLLKVELFRSHSKKKKNTIKVERLYLFIRVYLQTKQLKMSLFRAPEHCSVVLRVLNTSSWVPSFQVWNSILMAGLKVDQSQFGQFIDALQELCQKHVDNRMITTKVEEILFAILRLTSTEAEDAKKQIIKIIPNIDSSSNADFIQQMVTILPYRYIFSVFVPFFFLFRHVMFGNLTDHW